MDGYNYFIFTSFLLLEVYLTYTNGNHSPVFINSDKRTNFDQHRVFELVRPLLYHDGKKKETTFEQGRHKEKTTLTFDAFKKRFVIDLHLNRFLFTKSYIEKTFNEKNEPVIKKPKNLIGQHCFYHGSIRGVPHSVVSISSCNGIRGHISDNEQSYYIEPTDEKGTHKLYIEADTRPSVFHTDKSDSKHSKYPSNATINSLHRKEFLQRSKRSIRAPASSNKNSRYVELYIVNDFSVYVNHRRDEKRIFQRSQEIANYVSKLYEPLNIYIALVGVEIWTRRDRIQISSFANTTLDNFLSYRRQSINPQHPNDNAQLITGILFEDSIVGKAIKMSICTFQYSAGVARDVTSSTTEVATTVAHELGHNFGMEHDNYSVCLCPEPKCIMATTGGGYKTVTKWSSCSQTVLKDNFEIGLDYCLKNIPQQLFEGPYCGNGYVEEGEECDCGLPEKCDSNCCNAHTCTLKPNAKCATGRCCDVQTCQPMSAATLCRPSPRECDLPEFCDGETEYCPSDVFISNGVACSGGQSYCYNGQCKTHTGQCKLLWGPTGRVSDPICFKMLNINGSKYGNCGYNWTSKEYKRCDKEDVGCGLLHCVHLNEKLMFWSEKISHATPATFLTKGNNKYVCRSAIMDVGLDMPDPGQVPDGAKCSEQKICLNKKCMPLSSVATPACPDCHGNGVCNTLGQCHCDEGFSPPFCDEPGHGGSLHSGPVKIREVNSLMIGLLIFFLVVCPIVIIIIAVINRKKLYVFWNKQVAVILYRVPKFTRRSKETKKDTPSGGRPTRNQFRTEGVDVSGPLLTERPQEKNTKPKRNSFAESLQALRPPSKPKPPPKVKSEAILMVPQPDIQRKLPSAPDLLKHDPIVKKDSFNKEISKPVLISTTDRRSKAFVRESSNEKLKEANKNGNPPPVPPHAALKPTRSDPPIRPPPRPLSMPAKSEKVTEVPKKSVIELSEKVKDVPKKGSEGPKKSVTESPQKIPLRPPPPHTSAQSDNEKMGRFDPNKRKKEKDKVEFPAAIAKFKPVKKTSTNVAKTSVEKKQSESPGDNKKTGPVFKIPSELKTKINRPAHKKDSSSGDKLTDQQKSDSQPSVAAMKAMFDQKDSQTGGSPTPAPRTAPKPGPKKVRSVNV